LNPSALNNLACSSHLLESTGKGGRADEELRAAMLTDPLSASIQAELGCNAYYARQYDRAIREFQKAHKIIREMDALRGRVFVDPFLEAVVYLSMNEMRDAYARLDAAYEVRSAFLISLKSDPKWDHVRRDPPLQAMLRRVGFSD